MSRLSELARWLWIETQLGAPPFVQHGVIPFLHQAKETARLLAQPFVPLYELKGQTQAGPLTVAYGGLGYAQPTLESLFFLEQPARREIGRVSVWRPGEAMGSITSDLIVIESGQGLIRKLPGQSAITLPFRVQFVLDIQGEWEVVEGRFRRSTRYDVRKAQKGHCYEYEISRREQDLKMFYHTMYLPNVQARHGDLAAVLPEREAYQLMRHGWLLLIKRDETYVCGVLVHAQQGVIQLKEMGLLNGDRQLMKEGVIDSMIYLSIRWAHQEGYEAVSFGDNWPYMSGIFQNKRKWGATVSISPHQHKRIWLRIQRYTPAVSQFLKSNPCVIVDGKGELHGLMVTDDPGNVSPKDEAKWQKLYETPGLSGLFVRSVTDLMERPGF
jgi:hypothetical protein